MFEASRAKPGAQTRAAFIALLAVGFAASAALPALARSHAHRGGVSHHRGRAAAPSIDYGPTAPEKDAALIEDATTGRVLYARNANELRHPASLTKMMTLYMLFEALQRGQVTMQTELPISWHAADMDPTKMGIPAGQSIPVEIAIKGIVVQSANDVAVAIAEALGGTESNFAQQMTEKARQLGMRNTFYHNASGLPDNAQITTAYDLALLGRHLAYDFPQYFKYFSTESFYYGGRYYSTHDNLLGNYDGCDGIKTGYTGASGFNLVSDVVRGRTHIIGVVMGGYTARRRDGEMMRLLDLAFGQINQNPALVASTGVPWQTMAQNTVSNPVLAGFDISAGNDNAPSVIAPQQAPQPNIPAAAVPPPRQMAALTPQQKPAYTPPQLSGAVPATHKAPDITVAIKHPPLPKPRPNMVLASLKMPPPDIVPVAKPRVREQIIGQGDYSVIRPVANKPAAMKPTAAKPAVAANNMNAMARDWSIQIGAFADMGSARAQLASYAEQSMDVLGTAERIVVPFQGADGQKRFRARFGPFAEAEARQICARLTQRGQTCFAAMAN